MLLLYQSANRDEANVRRSRSRSTSSARRTSTSRSASARTSASGQRSPASSCASCSSSCSPGSPTSSSSTPSEPAHRPANFVSGYEAHAGAVHPDEAGCREMNDLYRPMFLPDLLIAALERNRDRPAVYIDDDVLTAARLPRRDQPLRAGLPRQGIGQGDGVATLSKNRPEVLFSMGAVMVGGCRNTPLHPLGSLDDHALRPEDAEIDDAGLRSRASPTARGELRERVPGLRAPAVVRAGRRRRRPRGAGGDVRAAAARRPAGRRRGPVGARLHGRHDRQAQGRDEHVPGQRHDDPDHGVGVAVARRGPPPHLHAAQPRRRVASSCPLLLQRRLDASCSRRSTPARCWRRSSGTASPR